MILGWFMDKNMVVKLLEHLELMYPNKTSYSLIHKWMDSPLKIYILPIIQYLKESNKIRVYYATNEDSKSESLKPTNEIIITSEGIDFLEGIKLRKAAETRNFLIALATIVIGLSALINLAVLFLTLTT